VAWMQWRAFWFAKWGLSRTGGGRLHFEDGSGSLWTGAGVWSTAGGEDAGDRGGRGYDGESVAQERGYFAASGGITAGGAGSGAGPDANSASSDDE
jgi:hypothetical protein